MKSGFYISDYTVFAILQTADVILPTVCINNTFLLPNIYRKHQTQDNQNQNIKHKTSKSQKKNTIKTKSIPLT